MIINDIKNIKSNRVSLRKFGLLIGAVLFFIAVFMWWKEIEVYNIVGITGILFLAIGLTIPIALLPLHKIWMAFSIILGWFMSRVILLLLYYLVLTPTALLYRLTGKKFLELLSDPNANTYWNSREDEEFNKKEYERQF